MWSLPGAEDRGESPTRNPRTQACAMSQTYRFQRLQFRGPKVGLVKVMSTSRRVFAQPRRPGLVEAR